MFPALLLAVAGSLADTASRAFVESLQSEPVVRAPAISAADALSCIQVRTWHAVMAEDGDVAVDLLADGTTALGRRKELPVHWLLHLVAGTNGIASVRTLEEVVATDVVQARDEAERQAIVEACVECDRAALSIAIGDEALMRSFHEMPNVPLLIENADFAARLADESGNVSAQVNSMVVLAYTGTERSAHLALARDALALAETKGTCDDQAMALLVLGNSFVAHDRSEEGIRAYQRGASLVDRVDDPRSPLKSLHNLAVHLSSRGKVPQAVDTAAKLAALSARYGWKEGEAAASIDLADVYTFVARFDLAAAARQRAYELFLALGNDEWAAEELFQYADGEATAGHERHAAALFERGIALGRPVMQPGRLAISISSYAVVLARQGRLAEADRWLREAIGNDSYVGGSIALSAAAVELIRHRPREALVMADHALRGHGDRPSDQEWTATTIRGRALAQLGRRAEAERAFRKAVALLERHRSELPPDVAAREHFFASRSEPYHELITLLVRLGRPRDALAVAERLKARTLADILNFPRRPDTPARERELMAELARRRKLLARHAASAGDVLRARQQLDAFRGEMRWRAPATNVETESPALTSLPPGAALVEFVVAPRSTTIFVLRGGVLRVRRIDVRRADLVRDIDALLEAVASRRLDYSRFAAPLGRELLQPIEPWLQGATRVYVSPDDALWRLPFAVLPMRDGEPLLARHELVLAPSQRLISARTASAAPRHLVAFGNPAVYAAPAPYFTEVHLREVVTEVAAIGQMYPGSAEVYTASDAGEDRFKWRAPAADVIHVAAHASVSEDWPMESALLLAPAGREDGQLEAQEILNLHLHCGVAILAGCNTAGGRFGVGEGVMGLSWAFLAAGARNAVVSQWNVDSAATERLMVAVHYSLVRGASPPTAVRRAALALRNDPAFAHPFYWAPFVVIGSGQ